MMMKKLEDAENVGAGSSSCLKIEEAVTVLNALIPSK